MLHQKYKNKDQNRQKTGRNEIRANWIQEKIGMKVALLIKGKYMAIQ